MAGLAAVLKALARVVGRDLRSFNSVTGNNFFLFVLLLLVKQPPSSVFFDLIFGLLFLFPLSADPLRKIPAERLAMWPFTRAQRAALRVASAALSPAAWITVALIAKTARPANGLRFLVLAVSIQALAIAATRLARRAPHLNLLRDIPALPGRLGGLIRKDMRQLFTTLDFYVALLLSLAGFAFRLAGPKIDPEAFGILAILVALALSTYAQCLFGLDLPWGWMRYRILPLRGWQILLAKGVAYLAALFVLVLPLAPLAGFTAGLAALAIGQREAVRFPAPQHRWRFTGGALFPTGLLQVIFVFGAGINAQRESGIWLGASIVAYGISLWHYGRAWDRLYRA